MKITTQKIKKLIIISIFMITCSLSLVFHSKLNPIIVNFFSDNFNIVSNKGNLLVHFIDVGQADASAINLPDGKVMLIDSGSKDVSTTYINYLKENVLNTKIKDVIDYLVLSHADMDHIGGAMKLLKTFDVRTVFLPKIESDSNGYNELLNYVQFNCDYFVLGDEFLIEQDLYSIKFFEILNSSNTNDSSQVVKLECGNKSFLFTGDISKSVELKYIEIYEDELDVDVLKISHHGSNTATSEAFIQTVSPEYAVISVGEGNDYGHPSYEVLNILQNAQSKIYRTDLDSDILFVVDDDYKLTVLNDIYYITGLSLDYSYFIVILDVCLIVSCVFIVLKKEKKNKR